MNNSGRLIGRRVLVTGASGIVGRGILPDLLRAGAHVVSISRNIPAWYSDLPAVGRHQAIKMDLRMGAPSELGEITDCIHLAATLFPVSPIAFFNDNIQITKNVVSACARYGRHLERFIHVSSLAARGPGTSADYPDPRRDARAVSNYGESKFACEAVAKSLLPDSVRLAILRPGIVLSRHDRRLLLTAKTLHLAPSSVLARLPEAMSAIAVEDLSQGIVAALTPTPALSGVFEICHPQPIRLNVVVGRDYGVHAERGVLSGLLMGMVAAASTGAAFIIGAPPLLTFDKLREVQQASWCADSTSFTAATGWQAITHPHTFLQPYLKSNHASA